MIACDITSDSQKNMNRFSGNKRTKIIMAQKTGD